MVIALEGHDQHVINDRQLQVHVTRLRAWAVHVLPHRMIGTPSAH